MQSIVFMVNFACVHFCKLTLHYIVSFLQWRFDLTVPTTSLAYFVLFMFAIKTVVRNTEWWDTKYLAEAGMKTNPLNAKMFMTMGNVLAQKVRSEFLYILM